jgi:hypothetical protein
MGEAVSRIRKQLTSALREHEKESVELNALLEQIETEIEVHRLLLSLGRNELLLEYIDQLEEDFTRAASLKSNGLSDEDRSRLHLPAGVRFEVGPDAERLADITMLVQHKTWTIQITWHDRHGMIVRPLKGHRNRSLASPSSDASESVRSLLPSDDEA